jgi:DNA-binding MarR family transcriptional regulator
MSVEKFVQVPLRVFELLKDGQINKTEFIVLAAILTYVNRRSGLATMRNQTICGLTGFGKSTVSASIKNLIRVGALDLVTGKYQRRRKLEANLRVKDR